MASLTPEERARLEATADVVSQIRTLADQARDAAIAALHGEVDRNALIAQLGEAAERAAADEPADSSWAQLALYLHAVVAVLLGEPALPVPAAFAEHLAAVEAARSDSA